MKDAYWSVKSSAHKRTKLKFRQKNEYERREGSVVESMTGFFGKQAS